MFLKLPPSESSGSLGWMTQQEDWGTMVGLLGGASITEFGNRCGDTRTACSTGCDAGTLVPISQPLMRRSQMAATRFVRNDSHEMLLIKPFRYSEANRSLGLQRAFAG